MNASPLPQIRYAVIVFCLLISFDVAATESAKAQTLPLLQGELTIKVKNYTSRPTIYVDHEDIPYATMCSWYPVLTGYDHQSYSAGDEMTVRHVDRNHNCPADSYADRTFGYGVYKISINGDHLFVDFRDANYGPLVGSYEGHMDMNLDYDCTTHQFTDRNSLAVLELESTYAIWDMAGVESQLIPITVTSPTGYVLVDNSSASSPYQEAYYVGEESWFAAYNPSTSEQGDHFSLTFALDDFGMVYDFPAAPTGISISGAIGQHPTISWSANQESDLNGYKLYRKVTPYDQQFSLIATFNTSTRSYTDPEIVRKSVGITGPWAQYYVKAYDQLGLVSLASSTVSTGCENPAKPSDEVTKELLVNRLYDAYPNPFNPSTVIKYTIGEVVGKRVGTSKVKLTVYDVAGREVAMLVNEEKAPGSYEATFDGSGLSSGVYVCRLTAGSYVESRRVMLIK
jgi:hypothetical protein